jgi:hypothetical protein
VEEELNLWLRHRRAAAPHGRLLLLGSERGMNAGQGHKNGLSLVPGALVEELVVEVLDHGLDLPKLLDLPQPPLAQRRYSW